MNLNNLITITPVLKVENLKLRRQLENLASFICVIDKCVLNKVDKLGAKGADWMYVYSWIRKWVCVYVLVG